MSKQLVSILRLVCVALAALLVSEASGIWLRRAPLARLALPAVPTLEAAATNSPAGGTNANRPVTNASGSATNRPGTNAPGSAAGTNSPSSRTNAPSRGTNAPAVGTNAPTTGTNTAAAGTNRAVNAAAATRRGPAGGNPRPPRGGGGPGGMAGLGPDTPPEIKARIERIYQSELFGPVNHPVPAALIGIAGDQAFLRAANGQTGPVKVGAELGGLKLLRIGVNRVLVEEDGEQKELMVFAGFGGDSLLTQKKDQSQ